MLLCRRNLNLDTFWPSDAVPSLHLMVLINGALIGCVTKHLATAHLRVLIVGHITAELGDARKASKHIATYFPLLD